MHNELWFIVPTYFRSRKWK